VRERSFGSFECSRCPVELTSNAEAQKPKRKLQSDLSDFSVVGPRILLSLITVPRPPSLPDARPAGGDQNCRGCPAAPPFTDPANQVPVVLVEGSELLCAFAGKTSVNAKKGTVSSLAEANGHMSRMR
jgi:hypothetical protein